jgi:hypothetical protein
MKKADLYKLVERLNPKLATTKKKSQMDSNVQKRN